MYKGVLIGHPLMNQCSKYLSRHRPLSQRQWLERIQQVPEVDLNIDFYNAGPAIEILERKVAALLGKQKALFFHKGMVAQNSALMEYTLRAKNKKIAIHPQSHIQVDESLAYEKLMGLEVEFFGRQNAAITVQDIQSLPHSLAAICVELPVRRAGFKLPEWHTLKELQRFSNHCEIPVHFDGARILESVDYWDKSYDEVSALCDSVYVSLYKTLGAAAGGVIAGNEEFISSLSVWRSRFGGDMYTAFPYVLSALWGLEHYLPRISEFNQRALKLAQQIANAFGPATIPNPVQCSGFVVELPVSANTLEIRALSLAERENIWLFDRIYDSGGNTSRFEIQVGDALDDWDNVEVIAALAKCISGASHV